MNSSKKDFCQRHKINQTFLSIHLILRKLLGEIMTLTIWGLVLFLLLILVL